MTDRRSDATWTLDELTSETGVTVRTVRYYIAEGLLPPPEGAGRAARYTEDHRNRLDLIATLKDRHLPLREIRQALRDLGPEEIAAHAARAREASRRPRQAGSFPLAASPDWSPAGARREPGDRNRGGDAMDYIRSVREAPAPYAAVPEPARSPDQRWHRLEITPEAELLVTEEVWRRRREQIDTLLAWARRMIGEP